MIWTIAVPLKAAGLRKSRLADTLRPADRERAVALMLAKLARLLAERRDVRALLVSPQARGDWPFWHQDDGTGLNAALADARRRVGEGPFAVIHPDLPFLEDADLTALLDLAMAEGMAVAADRHGSGTNAIAIADGRPVEFMFGPDSLARFANRGRCGVLHRYGLAVDIDTAADLRLAQQAGTLPLFD